MKMSISNIAWDEHEELEVFSLMDQYGFNGIEIAPTKIWSNPTVENPDILVSYKNKLKKYGKNIVALQSLLYGTEGLNIFGNVEVKKSTFEYLKKIIFIGGQLGAKALVFGSPNNRKRGTIPINTAIEIAAKFFCELGDVAKLNNTNFCIEPNPPSYNCDFIQNVTDAINFLKIVDHPNVQLNLDIGVMTINEEEYEKFIDLAFNYIAHIHISEPGLAVIGKSGTNHKKIAEHLKNIGYDKWISIEMRNGFTNPNTLSVEYALRFVENIYS